MVNELKREVEDKKILEQTNSYKILYRFEITEIKPKKS